DVADDRGVLRDPGEARGVGEVDLGRDELGRSRAALHHRDPGLLQRGGGAVQLISAVAGVLPHLVEHDAERFVAGGELGATLDEAADLVQREEAGERPADAERYASDLLKRGLDPADLPRALSSDALQTAGETPELTLGEITLRPQALHPRDQAAVERRRRLG